MNDLIKRSDAVRSANDILEPDNKKRDLIQALYTTPSQGKIAQVGEWKVHYIGVLSQAVYEHETCGHIQLVHTKHCPICGESML